MPGFDKPSSNEEEYFARQETERKRKLADDQRARIEQEERERRRALHHMKCPKCGMDLQEINAGDVHVDKCFSCEGIWLDAGELERLSKKEGFFGKLTKVFQRGE
jgi:hypothetical protein